MEEITRFDMDMDGSMESSDHGQWVRYEDVSQRTWVGLTKEEIAEFDTWHDNREEEVGWCNPSEIVAYIESKLRSKNNG